MRLCLSGFGLDIVDIEIRVLRRSQGDHGPIVTGSPLEDSERSEPSDPDTIAFGFTAS